MISVSINNSPESFEEGFTVLKALDALGYEKLGMLGVAINQNFIAKDLWADTVLQDNDKVDILKPMSGG